MRNPGLTKSFLADTDISGARIVRLKDDDTVELATAVGHLSVGVTETLDVLAGEAVDVVLSGVTPVTYGAAVAVGEKLTAAASGKAVPISAATDEVIGIAMVAGVLDDEGSVLLTQS